VIGTAHFKVMKDGAIICNSGHFNVEIDLPGLEKMTRKRRLIRPSVEEHLLETGKRINVLGEGRLVNLAAAEGHPSSVMDMSFANQALALEYMVKRKKPLPVDVYPVPQQIDKAIAKMKLASMNISIDKLTKEQKTYLSSWDMGT
jgi:adenosylhomocysteinase